MDPKFPQPERSEDTTLTFPIFEMDGDSDEFLFKYEGEEYQVRVSKDNKASQPTVKATTFLLQLESPESDSLVASLTIKEYNDGQAEARSYINKDNTDGQSLPKGIGVAFYESIISSFQNWSEKNKRKLKHIVEPNRVLKKEKWNAIFTPVLERNGYVPRAESEGWEKTYEPQK